MTLTDDNPPQHWRSQDPLLRIAAAAARGEEVVVDKAGVPFATIVPRPEALALESEARAAKRRAAFGCLAVNYKNFPPEAFDIPHPMADEELEDRFKRKFG